jgi:hypothetical protein
MRAVHFTNWLEVLEADANLEAPERDSYLITIRWFLGYCKRRGSAATAGEARAFVEEMRGRKHPKQWVEERWKTALNWFFIEAKRYREAELESCSTSVATNTTSTDEREIAKQEARSNAGRRGPDVQTARLESSEPEWTLQFIRGVRIRQFSYTATRHDL